MIRLAAGLGFGKNGPLRWPAMGSEIALEVRVTQLHCSVRQVQLTLDVSSAGLAH